jgi:hypothetical protein
LSLPFIAPILQESGLRNDADFQNHLVSKIYILLPGRAVEELISAIDAVFAAPHQSLRAIVEDEQLHPHPTLNAITFVSPFAIRTSDLFGETSSGLLGSLISEFNVVVFDGDLFDSWMELLGNSLGPSRRLDFGDGITFQLTEKHKFILETSGLSRASPSTIDFCPSFFIGGDLLPFPDRLSYFIDSLIDDDRLVEPFSHRLAGSDIKSAELADVLVKFGNHFIPPICQLFPHNQPVSMNHCFFTFYTLLNASFRHCYIPDLNSPTVVHTAAEFLSAGPQFALFSLFWAFAGVHINAERAGMDTHIRTLASDSAFPILFSGPILDYVYDFQQNTWKLWSDLSSAQLLLPDKLIDSSLGYLLAPPPTILPAVHIATTLLSQNNNVFIYGSADVNKEILADMVIHTPHVLDHFAPSLYGFSGNGTPQNAFVNGP